MVPAIDHHDWNRLARFAAGECTAEEAEKVARWVAEAPERGEALAFIRDLDAAAEAGRPQWDTDASWERLVARRSARARLPLRLLPAGAGRREPRWPRVVAAAAAIMVTVGSLVGMWQLWRVAGLYQPAVAAAGGTVVRATLAGQRGTFRLPDGSLVILAPASRLRYPASYGATAGRRDIYLEGLALFEVKHDARRPFLVHTAHGVTEDLGTTFTVQEYAGDTTVQVVVAEGRVELRATETARSGALLRPGQLGHLTRSGTAIVRSDVDLARQLAWTQGRLVFDDTPLRDVLPHLARWYDLEFVLGDSALGARHLTASLAGEAISETLTLLSSTLDLTYTRHGRMVTFLPRRPTR